MAISGISGVHVILALFAISFIFLIDVSSVSVSITKKESALPKSLSKVHRPHVPAPEFPKFVPRPSKNPPSQPSTSPSGSPNHHHSQQYKPSQSQIHHQQPILYQSFSQNQHVNNVVPSIQISSPTAVFQEQDDDEMPDDLSEEEDHQFHDGSTPFENYALSSAPHPNGNSQEKVLPSMPQTVMNLPALIDNPEKIVNQVNGEKIQETSVDFSIPPHVTTILNALGGGGSLAQAAKPEKDSAGHGYTTANAIGYATGDNATVTASVSNKLEVNPHTVILTEYASANANSLANGTAFSTANLGSNGWGSKLGQGGLWPAGPGSGWAKASKPIKKERRL